MIHEGYAEVFSWNLEKIEEASVKVLEWYSSVFNNRDTSSWRGFIRRIVSNFTKRN